MKEIKHQDHLDNMARQGTPVRHTPGPWVLMSSETYTVRAPDDGAICQLKWLRGQWGLGGRREEGEVMANARLIATAPAMLAELEWLYEKYHHDSTRTVLTKAKGIV